VRTFSLASAAHAPGGRGTQFTMTETISGLMLPMIARTLPDFAPVCERYAADLKQAAEAVRQELR
jgi:hypothetical protein